LRRYSPTNLCDGAQTAIFGDVLRSAFPASRVQYISHLHSKATSCVEVCQTSNLRRLRLGEDISRQSCAMVRRWRFLRHFCVLYFQRAACITFQTCILNSHEGHTMCGSMVDIQSPTAEIRRGTKKKIEITGQKYNGLLYSIGRP